ncbi:MULTISPECIES: hypothetical protein [Haloarcula]|nr:hypothetical protein [Haloarcula amylolytica]
MVSVSDGRALAEQIINAVLGGYSTRVVGVDGKAGPYLTRREA